MHKKKFILPFLLSLWMTLLYSLLVVDFPKRHPLFRFKDTIVPSGPRVERAIDLKPDHYLLKIIYKVYDGRRKTVIFNDEIISVFQVRRKGEKETDYFHIHPEQIRSNNSLKIDFGPAFPEEVKIRLQNYRHGLVAKSVIEFFRPTPVHLLEFAPLRTMIVFLLAYLFFAAVFSFVGETHKKTGVYVIVVFNISLSVIAINNFLPLSQHVVFIAASYFWFWSALAASFIILLYTARIVRKKVLFHISQIPQ